MFGFIIKKMYFRSLSTCTIAILDKSLASSSNENKIYIFKKPTCHAKPTFADINSIYYYPFTVSGNEWRGSCNIIINPYAPVCVPYKVKNIFNLMSGVNETRFLVEHESCECKCGLNESVCNSNKNGIIMNVGVSAKS